MGIDVREATPADATVVRDVHLASIEGLGPIAYDEAVVAAWAHDRDPDDYPIEYEKTHFVVAEREGDGGQQSGNGREGTVGFGWLGFEPGEHLVSDTDAEVVEMRTSL